MARPAVAPPLTPVEVAALEQLAASLRGRAGGELGAMTSARLGRGYELYGHDPWQPGDDVRHVDWQARVRTGALWVRRHFAEGDSPLRVVVDRSASMGEAKHAAARRLAAALLVVATASGGRVALDVLGAPPEPPRADRDWAGRIRARLAPTAATARLDLVAALTAAAGRGARTILLSDLADPAPPARIFAAVARLGRQVHCYQLVHPADARLPGDAGAVRAPERDEVRGLRGLDEARFRARAERWREALAGAARAAGVDLRAVEVSPAPELVAWVRDAVARWR